MTNILDRDALKAELLILFVLEMYINMWTVDFTDTGEFMTCIGGGFMPAAA